MTMPYEKLNDLRKHAQEVYMEAYKSAWEQYDEPRERRGDATPEETARRVAWAAVKRTYEKNEKSGKWQAIDDK
jgi:cation transport regulator